jgi:virginiamycin A acetyltransferase
MMALIRLVFDIVGFAFTIPFWLPVIAVRRVHSGVSLRLFQQASQALALGPGDIGNLLRRCFYRMTLDQCSARCTISFGTIFSTPRARIGRGVYIGAYCSLGDCTIDDDCLLGSFVSVLSGKMTHRFSRLDIPIRMQGGELQHVAVGPDAWIGNGAIVFVSVPRGAVIGAGTVLTRTPEPMAVVVGNPGRTVSRRDRDGTPAPREQMLG